MEKNKFLILGAGPSGLGAAYRLKEHGITDFLILDASSEPGGLAGSVTDEKGFLWDLGGHVHFSHYPYYDQVLDEALGKDGWFSLLRNSQIWMNGGFIPFPFQNNIHKLPLFDRGKCFLGLVRASLFKSSRRPNNFDEWILSQYGKGIADIFLTPYNLKVWAHPLAMMATQWMGERVAPVQLGPVIKSLLSGEDQISWGPNNMFRFPKKGGTGAVWKAVAAKIGNEFIKLNTTVRKVDSASKTVSTPNGDYSYETLISTLPLDQLGAMASGISSSSKEASQHLKHSSTHIVGLGLKGKLPPFLKGVCWMYFPQNDIPFYRATVFSNYSPKNVPDPDNQWSLMMEISETQYYRNGLTDPIGKTIDALKRHGFIENEQSILSRWHKRLPYGYPTPHLERDEILRKVQPELESLRIYSRGRFGGWKYEVSNQDHSFMQGVELIDRLVLNKPEVTYSAH